MNKKILITGHSRGLGKAITEKLLNTRNFEIIGISRNLSGIQHPLLKEIQCDLSQTKNIFELGQILQNENFNIVILNAGANRIKPPESYSLEEIQNIIQLNFTSNALLLRICINGLIKNKGHIIGIGSYSGIEIKKWNNFYGASKSALHHLLRSIFEQYRKQGIRTTIVIPDIMNSEFYIDQEYKPLAEANYSLQVDEVASLISNWIIQPPQFIPLEIVLRPQMFQLKRNAKKSN